MARRLSGFRLIFTASLFFSFTGFPSNAAPSIAGDTTENDKKVVCYYSSWSGYRPSVGAYNLDDIPVHLCTHVVYAFIGVNNRTWELLVLDPMNDITKGGYRRFTSLKKKNPSLKTLIALGGWVEGGQKYSELVAVPERRRIFVSSVLDFLKWFNFDGLDLDWEFPGSSDRDGRAEDRDNFVQLVKELREAFDKEGWGWILTAMVPIMRFRVESGYNVPKLASMLDHIHLLTYDLRGNWTGFTDIHTPLRRREFDVVEYEDVNLQDGTQLWRSLGTPAAKIVVSLAFYGRTYTLANETVNGLHAPLQVNQSSGNEGPYTKASGTLAYYEICEEMQSGGWEKRYDRIGMSPYMVKGDQWVGYEDQQSLTEKVKFVQNMGFGGIAVWSVDLDDFQGICGQAQVLLQSIHKQLMKNAVHNVIPQVSLETHAGNQVTKPSTSITTQQNVALLKMETTPEFPLNDDVSSHGGVHMLPVRPTSHFGQEISLFNSTESHMSQEMMQSRPVPQMFDVTTPASLSMNFPLQEFPMVAHQDGFRSTMKPTFHLGSNETLLFIEPVHSFISQQPSNMPLNVPTSSVPPTVRLSSRSPTVHSPLQSPSAHTPIEPPNAHIPLEPTDVHTPLEPPTVHTPVEPPSAHTPIEPPRTLTFTVPRGTHPSSLATGYMDSSRVQTSTLPHVVHSSTVPLRVRTSSVLPRVHTASVPLEDQTAALPLEGHASSVPSVTHTSATVAPKTHTPEVPPVDAHESTTTSSFPITTYSGEPPSSVFTISSQPPTSETPLFAIQHQFPAHEVTNAESGSTLQHIVQVDDKSQISDAQQLFATVEESVSPLRQMSVVDDQTDTQFVDKPTVASLFPEPAVVSLSHESTIVPLVHGSLVPIVHQPTVAPLVHQPTVAPLVHESPIAPSVHESPIAPSVPESTDAPSVHELLNILENLSVITDVALEQSSFTPARNQSIPQIEDTTVQGLRPVRNEANTTKPPLMEADNSQHLLSSTTSLLEPKRTTPFQPKLLNNKTVRTFVDLSTHPYTFSNVEKSPELFTIHRNSSNSMNFDHVGEFFNAAYYPFHRKTSKTSSPAHSVTNGSLDVFDGVEGTRRVVEKSSIPSETTMISNVTLTDMFSEEKHLINENDMPTNFSKQYGLRDDDPVPIEMEHLAIGQTLSKFNESRLRSSHRPFVDRTSINPNSEIQTSVDGFHRSTQSSVDDLPSSNDQDSTSGVTEPSLWTTTSETAVVNVLRRKVLIRRPVRPGMISTSRRKITLPPPDSTSTARTQLVLERIYINATNSSRRPVKRRRRPRKNETMLYRKMKIINATQSPVLRNLADT